VIAVLRRVSPTTPLSRVSGRRLGNAHRAGLVGRLTRVRIERGEGQAIHDLVVHRNEHLPGLDRMRDEGPCLNDSALRSDGYQLIGLDAQ
jgi:hypothetical protein